VIDNYPENQVEEMEAVNILRTRALERGECHSLACFTSSRMTFAKNAEGIFPAFSRPRGSLRYGYFITCKSVVKNDKGEAVEVHCTYDPATRGGNAPDGRKVKSTIHWVSAANAIDAEVRITRTCSRKRIRMRLRRVRILRRI